MQQVSLGCNDSRLLMNYILHLVLKSSAYKDANKGTQITLVFALLMSGIQSVTQEHWKTLDLLSLLYDRFVFLPHVMLTYTGSRSEIMFEALKYVHTEFNTHQLNSKLKVYVA